MSENNFTDVFNDPNLPVDNQHIDDFDDREEPREEVDNEGERQDTPPIAQTREEVLANLARNGEKNLAESEAIKYGVDFDADTKDEYNREKL